MAVTIDGTLGVSLVQDGVVTAADLSSTLDLSGKTVTLPAGVGGKVLQVQGATSTTISSTSSNTFITGHSLSITPSSASSKIVVMGNGVISHSTYQFGGRLRVARIVGGVTTSVLEGVRGFAIIGHDNYSSDAAPSNGFSFVDSPSTTSACTYAIQFATANSTVYFNKFQYRNEGSISSLVLMEIAG